MDLSEKFALQMEEGDFSETHDIMSPVMKLQMSEAALKQAWDTTRASIGAFVGLYDTTNEEVQEYNVIHVVLQYENNGMKVSFTYNKSGELDGLWLSYQPIEVEAVSNEEFKIQIDGDDYEISGMLTLPNNVDNPPVAILVHGSGTNDMDETIGGNKPFRDIAHGLARQGIGTIRYNEYLLEHIENAPSNYTIYDDSLNDASAAISYALTCNQVDSKQIYIIGHSLGGMMAPKIATDHEEVAGIILLAGSPRSLLEISLDQYKNLLEAEEDLSKEEKEELINQRIDEIQKINRLSGDKDEVILGVPASYWHSLNQIDHGEYAKNLEIPIHIMQGTEDFQVFVDIDYVQWQDILEDKDNVTFDLYEGLNHLFMESSGYKNVEEYLVKSTVAQEVIDDIAGYILDY